MKKIIIHAMSVICIASSAVFTMNASEPGSATGSQSGSLSSSPEQSPRDSRKRETPLMHADAITQLHDQDKAKKKEHHSVIEKFAAEIDEKEHQLKDKLHEKAHHIAEGLHLLKSDDEEKPLHTTQIHDDIAPTPVRPATPINTPATPRTDGPAHVSGFSAPAAHNPHPAASTSKSHATKALAPHLSHAPASKQTSASTHDSSGTTLVKNLEQNLSKVETKIEQEVSKIEKEIEDNTDKSNNQPSAQDASHVSNPIVVELTKDAQQIETEVKEIETVVTDEIQKEEAKVTTTETKIADKITGAIEDQAEAAAAADALSWWKRNASSLKIAGIGAGIMSLIMILYHLDRLPAGLAQKLDAYLPQFLAKSTSAIHRV